MPDIPSAQIPALLVLEDGRFFRGTSFGATGTTYGEAVFSTGMSGYQETLTDPSYHRQVVVATAPHIGNTGWNDEDSESKRIWVAGYVVRNPARRASNWRMKRTLDDELRAQHIVGIADIDTRALTIHLRERGAMRVGVSTEILDVDQLRAKVLESPQMAGANLVGDVTTKTPYVIPAEGEQKFRVALLDLGLKSATPREMARRGIECHVLPADSTFQDIQALNPDGFFLSNGPGDPATLTGPAELCRQVLDASLPFFGICLGNQVFAHALGLETYKLKYGHRGINQPVLDRASGKIDITAHNHGFAVSAPLDHPVDTDFGQVEVSHYCLNDDVVEGLRLTKDGKVRGFSVQYHPEAAAGPHDAGYLFDRFATIMKEAKNA
jgi:carbamoyl-phosphate synthase small subunit